MDLFNLNIICEEPEPKKLKKSITTTIQPSNDSSPRITAKAGNNHKNNRKHNKNIKSESKRKDFHENNSKTHEIDIITEKDINDGGMNDTIDEDDDSSINEDGNNNSPKESRKVSRRHHNKDFLDDVENRAKYMSEFHARPLEIDRRNNAKSNILQSKTSNHLFEQGNDETNNPFSSIGIQDKISDALVSSSIFGLKQPTVIQKKAISALLGGDVGKKNVFIQSETGSGKTFSYLIPIIQSIVQNINPTDEKKDLRSKLGTKCIILSPTRELTNQTFQITEKLCRFTYNYIIPGLLTGGEKRKSEKNRIRKGITIIISTPGRLLDHMDKTECLLGSIKQLDWFVLDEVDRLLDMGLGSQVKKIVNLLQGHLGCDVCSWNSILVSATIHKEVQKLGWDCFGGDSDNWTNISANKNENKISTKIVEGQDDDKLSNATPRQLMHMHMIVSAKLRLSALISFLVSRVHNKERTVIFMSTCDSVDFHYRLFLAMGSIMKEGDDENEDVGIFGKQCSIFRLHGNVPFQERNKILMNFSKEGKSDTEKASILIATDVVARGLNIPKVDWILQYDPPCEMADYVHRAGRAARAGEGGHALLFLLPSEQKYLEALQLRGLQSTAPLSLTSTLYDAIKLCNKDIVPVINSKKKSSVYTNSNREAEAFASSIQHKLEECVSQSKNNEKVNKKRKRNNPTENKKQLEKEIYLTDLASKAFTSYIRAYSTREKAVRHIFSARALHLGHIAKSFGLKEGPRQIVKKESSGKKAKGKTSSFNKK